MELSSVKAVPSQIGCPTRAREVPEPEHDPPSGPFRSTVLIEPGSVQTGNTELGNRHRYRETKIDSGKAGERSSQKRKGASGMFEVSKPMASKAAVNANTGGKKRSRRYDL